MGGNALTTVAACRLRADAYHALAGTVMDVLSRAFPLRAARVIPAYRRKESFGDMDVLLASDAWTEDDFAALQAAFHAVEMVRNGTVVSLGLALARFGAGEGFFQLDVILTPAAGLRAACNYFAWNDCGNLLGRIAHGMGLKLGHKGLSYPFRDGSHLFDDIHVTDDWEVILPALGYDHSTWAAGFDTLEDLFRFVSSGTFFRREIFLLENRNHQSRTRDRKRMTYMAFLDWIEDLPGDAADPRPHAAWLPYLFDHLPGFAEKYRSTEARHARHQAAKARFNGARVQALTGLRDKALGALMKRINARFPSRVALEDWVLSSDQAAIDVLVMDAWRTEDETDT